MAEVMHRFGDLVTAGVVNLQARRRGGAPPDDASAPTATIDPVTGKLPETGAVAEVIS
jgi:hypothetical protein